MTSDKWSIKISRRLSRDIQELPEQVRLKMLALLKDIEIKGPVQPGWPNYSKLGNDKFHCHIKKGRPTYVVCWQVVDKEVRLVEVYYAGTHEKAPY